MLISSALALALWSPKPARAQLPRTDSGIARAHVNRILGVYDDLGSVAGAEVLDLLSCQRTRDSRGVLTVDMSTCARATTSVTGNVSLSWVLALRDTALVRIRKMGYADTSFALPVTVTDTASEVIVLERVVGATPLATVTVVDSMQLRRYPMLRDFFDRQRRGMGRFLGPSVLRTWEQQGVESIDVALSKIGALERRTMTFKGQCRMAVFVNGQRSQSLPLGAQLQDLDAIEFYHGPAVAPTAFSNACGSIVYWTRTR